MIFMFKRISKKKKRVIRILHHFRKQSAPKLKLSKIFSLIDLLKEKNQNHSDTFLFWEHLPPCRVLFAYYTPSVLLEDTTEYIIVWFLGQIGQKLLTSRQSTIGSFYAMRASSYGYLSIALFCIWETTLIKKKLTASRIQNIMIKRKR